MTVGVHRQCDGGVAEHLLRDLCGHPCRQHQRRRRVPKPMQRQPGQVKPEHRPVHLVSQALGVNALADRRCEHQIAPVALAPLLERFCLACAVIGEIPRQIGRDRDRAAAACRFGRLGNVHAVVDADLQRGDNPDAPLLQVDALPGQRERFADAHAGRQHEMVHDADLRARLGGDKAARLIRGPGHRLRSMRSRQVQSAGAIVRDDLIRYRRPEHRGHMLRTDDHGIGFQARVHHAVHHRLAIGAGDRGDALCPELWRDVHAPGRQSQPGGGRRPDALHPGVPDRRVRRQRDLRRDADAVGVDLVFGFGEPCLSRLARLEPAAKLATLAVSIPTAEPRLSAGILACGRADAFDRAAWHGCDSSSPLVVEENIRSTSGHAFCHTIGASSMSDNLAGNAILFDRANSVLLSGRLALISDGHSRSEIVIRELAMESERRGSCSRPGQPGYRSTT